ncbi:YheC/YheD family protein [Bacillus songklensis]|uniref:YheC/YheD family protein n=1 Tax=Bacillus songklensis TaxID=1069116 RepID=A0ABV8B2Q8_9BACI
MNLSLIDEKQHTIYLPARYEHSDLRSISFGARTFPCTIIFSSQLEQEVLMSTSLFHELSIPFCQSVHLFFRDDTVHIGPLIGIFSAGFTGSKLRPIGQRSIFFSKLLSTVKSTGGYAFLFGAHHINWDSGTIRGYFYTNDGWSQADVPFPHVVYDRLPNRQTENHELFTTIKEKLQSQYLIPWYNPGFFNKWDIYQRLQTNEETQSFLPETFKNPSIKHIRSLLEKHQGVFLKPINGSLGKGIFEIIYSPSSESYYCRYHDGEKKVLRKFYQLPILLSHLFQEKKLDDYIVQQRIPLIRFQGRPLDFRVHTNKNEHGKWQLTAVAAKVAGRGSVTTHLNNGGMIKTIEEIFPSPDRCRDIKQQLEQAALLISETIERDVAGFIGEIGFDFGMDDQGRVWIFEANSKPGRSIFKHPKLFEQDMLTRKLSLSYAIHLAEKSIHAPEELYT